MIDPLTMAYVYDYDAFGLPRNFSVSRDYIPSTDEVSFTIRHQAFQYANFTMESFLLDRQGEGVVPAVRRAALELAHMVRDQMDLYIKECEE